MRAIKEREREREGREGGREREWTEHLNKDEQSFKGQRSFLIGLFLYCSMAMVNTFQNCQPHESYMPSLTTAMHLSPSYEHPSSGTRHCIAGDHSTETLAVLHRMTSTRFKNTALYEWLRCDCTVARAKDLAVHQQSSAFWKQHKYNVASFWHSSDRLFHAQNPQF